MNSQVLASCPWQRVCPLLMVSSALCSDDRATRPCVDGKQHRDPCPRHCSSDIAHSSVQVRTVQPKPSSHRFSNEPGLRSVRGQVQWVSCRAQRHVSNVVGMITPFRIALPASHVLVLAPFTLDTGEWGLVHLLCHDCLLQSCPELVRHRFIRDGLFVLIQLLRTRERAMCGSSRRLGSLLVHSRITGLPRRFHRTSVADSLPPWTSLCPHE